MAGSLFVPLQFRDYRQFWLGRCLALIGEYSVMTVLPAIVLDITRKPSAWGTVMLIQSIPKVVLMLAGGLVSDRYRPRSVMMAVASVQALLTFTVLLLISLVDPNIWFFYGWALVNGTLAAFFLPAANSMIPDLLPPDHLRSGNALYMMVMQTLLFVVPPLAGTLLVIKSSTLVLMVATVAPLLFVGFLWSIRSESGHHGRSSILEQVSLSFRVVREDKLLSTIIVLIALYMFGASGAVSVGLPALAKLTFHADNQGLGFVYGASGGGALLGAMIAGTLRRLPRQALVGSAFIACFGVALLGVSVAPSLWVALPLLVVAGGCMSAGALIYTTLVQTRVNADLRGRVMALVSLALVGMDPIAFGAAGLLGDYMGARGIIGLGALFVILSGVVGLLIPAMSLADEHRSVREETTHQN